MFVALNWTFKGASPVNGDALMMGTGACGNTIIFMVFELGPPMFDTVKLTVYVILVALFVL